MNLLFESKGRPVALALSAGQRHESRSLERVLDAVYIPRRGRGRPKQRPKRLLADRGYTGAPCREALRRRRIGAMIPTLETQRTARAKKGRKGGRPILFDKALYRLRSLAEQGINRLKQFRRVATRYDKRADIYLALATFASIIVWLRS